MRIIFSGNQGRNQEVYLYQIFTDTSRQYILPTVQELLTQSLAEANIWIHKVGHIMYMCLHIKYSKPGSIPQPNFF